MRSGTGLTEFSQKFPKRFFDVGIAEEHATAMAAGAAHQGCIPVLVLYSTFLQRAYDMLIHDVSIGKEHVVLAVDRAGLVGEDGETHQGAFDVNFLQTIPNMTILAPASFQELRDMLSYAVNEMDSPVAVRYPRGGEGEYKGGGVTGSKLLREGQDFTIVTYGGTVNDVLAASDSVREKGITCDVIKLDFIKPYDFDSVLESVKKTGRLMVVEECVSYGCVGDNIAARLTEEGQSPRRLILKNLGDNFIAHGAVNLLRKQYGLDAESIAEDLILNAPRKFRNY
jgi:1-deoxy-D-xylulose-5-phosphate synthase